jgi:hypothetical protein
MMSEQQFPWTLRVVQPLPGQFGWVVINHRSPDWPIRPEDIIAESEHCQFHTIEEAMSDAQETLGAPVSPEVKDWTVKVVDTTPGDWDVTKVVRIWETLLTKFLKIDAAYFHNDDMAFAA